MHGFATQGRCPGLRLDLALVLVFVGALLRFKLPLCPPARKADSKIILFCHVRCGLPYVSPHASPGDRLGVMLGSQIPLLGAAWDDDRCDSGGPHGTWGTIAW